MQEIPSQRQADSHLAKGLQHLGDGCGRHVALALGVAPHAGQQTHTEHRRSQGLDRAGGILIPQEGGKEIRLKKHQQRSHQPQREEQPDGRAEDLPLLVLPALGMGLTGQLGDGQRQAGSGKGQQKVVDLIGGVPIGHAHFP